MSSGNTLCNSLSNVVTGMLQYFNHFIDAHFIIPLYCNILIISLYLNVQERPLPHFFLFILLQNYSMGAIVTGRNKINKFV